MNEGDEEALALLKSVAEEDYHCLIVTRNNPTFINKVLDPFSVEIICMNSKNVDKKNASGLSDVVSSINTFSHRHEHAAVLLSRIDFLMMTYSFDQLLKSIYEINEITSQSSSLFLLHVSDPSLFTDRQLRLLQSELTVIPAKTLKDYLPDLELYTLFKYIKNEEKKYDTISFNHLRKKLDRSYPTIRKNAYSLKNKGFIEIMKKGREKIVFLTDKGKQIIKRCES
jgi:DNA-binding MarR family transcriptional regulator